MKVAEIWAVVLTIIASTAYAENTLLLPTEAPTASNDGWRCATKSISQFFKMPKPTGTLYSSLISYADELLEKCMLTGASRFYCPYPESTDLCKFSTVAPSTVLPAYSEYGSRVNSWWAERSAAASEAARDCPATWYSWLMQTPGGPEWLNSTIIFAGCYAEKHGKEEPKHVTATATGTGTAMMTTATASIISSSSSPRVITSTSLSGCQGRAAFYWP